MVWIINVGELESFVEVAVVVYFKVLSSYLGNTEENQERFWAVGVAS
jgi:hypothetical protein